MISKSRRRPIFADGNQVSNRAEWNHWLKGFFNNENGSKNQARQQLITIKLYYVHFALSFTGNI